MGSSVLEHSIKVRKPYTTTKQRERWSEDEHDKFLEALKLYGRAWRQIAEHIGSKTAVQIRSHAQKFFTKAVRESKTIEIPPPRPKKKPMHPYPRKLGSLPTVPVMEAFPVLEQDDTLPTSVSSSTSDQTNCCTSPVSSVAGSNPAGTWSCEQENGCHSATTSVDNEDQSLPQQTSDMEQDLGSDNSIPSKEASSMEAQPVSLKLFGKMVMVADPQKQSTSTFEDAEPAIAVDIAQQFPAQARDQSALDGAPWCSWQNNTGPLFYILPSHGNLAEFDEASVAGLSWENQSLVRGCSDDGSRVQKESSSTESNGAELSIKAAFNHVFGDLALNSRAEVHVKLRRSETSAFTSLKAIPKKDAKGFVPYKRCVAEREAENQKMINSSGGGGLQGVQLSL